MDAEVAVLVFVLYVVLFLDLYSVLCASGPKNTKRSWQQGNTLKESSSERDTIAMRKFMDVESEKPNKELPEIRLRREILVQGFRANGEIPVVKKPRLWGRT